MLRWKSWALSLVVLVALVAVGACTSDTLDDGDSADVVLEIVQLQTEPVTASAQSGSGTCSFSGGQCTTSSDCPAAEACQGTMGCELTVQEWTVNLENLPKSSIAVTQPYNDVIVNDVLIDYHWQIAGPPNTAGVRVGLGGVTIPINGTGSLDFFPISSAALMDPGVEGNTADLNLTFEGQTVEGSGVTVTTVAQLNVEDCP